MRLDLPIALVAATLTHAAFAADARAELDIIEAPVVDGRRATAGDLHGTVSLIDAEGVSGCTGTLVAPRVVVTAAHCLTEEDEETGAVTGLIPVDDVFVVGGVVDVGDATETQTYAVTRIVVHPGYPNEGASTNTAGAGRDDDVALLLVDRDVAGLSVATIPSVEDAMASLEGSTDVVISGYGATGPDRDDSGVLYIAETRFDGRYDAEIVLGGGGTPDTCPGDSGGPAYLIGDEGLWLVGVTSRAAEDSVATCGERGVYAFAPVYRDWFVANSNGLYTASQAPAPGPGPGEGPDDGDDWDDEEDCASGGFPSRAPIAAALALLGLLAWRRRASAG